MKENKVISKERELCSSCQFVINNGDYICTNEDSPYWDTVVKYACDLYEEYEGE